jgi:hypothetical protein
MKYNLENFPTCEKCPIFLRADQVRYDIRVELCEGVRARGKCPKDVWRDDFGEELREKRVSIEQFKKKNEKHRRFHEYPNGMLDMITEVLGVGPKVKEETKIGKS